VSDTHVDAAVVDPPTLVTPDDTVANAVVPITVTLMAPVVATLVAVTVDTSSLLSYESHACSVAVSGRTVTVTSAAVEMP
jgi:hypothetical protein